MTSPSGEAYYARAIETIQTGQRVLARNPELVGEELPDATVDPATWVNIRLRMAKPTGDFLEIALLRPVEWLAEHLAQTTALDGEYLRALSEARGTDFARVVTEVTSVIPTVDLPDLSPGIIEPITADSSTAAPWVFLTLHELEAVGPAEIVEVGPCPELEPGEGRLVTGTFSHQSGEVFDITVDGLPESIGCTGAHPFWSEDRHEFIPARDLRLGETLGTESGTLRQITRITPRRGPPVPVFNLEVDAEHVYYVSVDGVLVHNACAADLRRSLSGAGVFGDPGTEAHHLISRYAKGADEARSILKRHGVDLDSHWNGVYLPGKGAQARGAIHRHVHTNSYSEAVVNRLLDAETRGRAHVLRELQRIRGGLIDGTFPTLSPRHINF